MTLSRRLFFGGRIYTMSEDKPVADAMLIEGDRIVWVGSGTELSAVPTDAYEMVDLNGRIVLPGFIDSHVHLFYWARSLRTLDLSRAKSITEIAKLVRGEVKRGTAKGKGWIVGSGWKRERWHDTRWPDRSDLDKAAPNRPVALASKDDHILWVNSAMLELVGIDKNTADPEGGVIDRDSKGEPTGLLRETAAWQVYRHQPRPSWREAKSILADGFAEMFRHGCVGVGNFDTLNGFEFLQRLDTEGKLPVRVVQYLPADVMKAVRSISLRSGFGSQHLMIGGIKIFSDGSLGSRSASMMRPYTSSTNRGVAVLSPSELAERVKECARSGLACAIHAIGDQANHDVLDAFAGARRVGGAKLRHRIEHCQILAPEDVLRFRELGVIASMQPSHATADLDIMKRYLGRRRYHSYRFRTLIESGARVVFGSDAPIEPLNPLAGIYAAVVGKARGGGECFNSSQLISVKDAIRAFTLGGAEAVGHRHWRGSLEPSKKADFIMLNRDIMRAPREELLRTEVVATYIDGRLMYAQKGFTE